MNADLERTLGELDAATRACAARLRAAPQARTRDGFAAGVMAAVRVEDARAAASARRFRPPWRRAAASLAAAAGLALLLAAGRGWFLGPAARAPRAADLAACQRADGTFSSSSAAAYVQGFAVAALAQEPGAAPGALDAAVAALVRSQGADGGWANDRQSACNVRALRVAAEAGVAAARPAYRRGVRHLRARGLAELTPPEFARAARAASARLDARADAGLRRSAWLCAVAACGR